VDLRTATDRARYGGGPGSRREALAEAWRLRHRLRRSVSRARAAEQRAADRLNTATEAVCRA
jgi:hypothetical protein